MMHRQTGILNTIAGLFIACSLLAGCGPSESRKEHEARTLEIIECFEHYAEDIESVKDAESAKYAAIRMQKTNERLRQLVDQQPKMTELSKTDAKEIAELHGDRFKKARERIANGSRDAIRNAADEPSFRDAYYKMRTLISKVRF